MARILIVEDNRANLDLMTYLLTAFEHEPIGRTTGEEALETIRRDMPDLIICDLQLPGIDGFEVGRRIKEIPSLRRIPLIAVTAYAMVGDRDKVLASGFDGYISKPIVPETFVGQIQAYLPSEQRSEAPARHSEPAATPPLPTAVATLLVVDNSRVNLQLIESTLGPFGYRVVAAGSVSEALELLETLTPDMILSDVHMPGASGLELIQAVKRNPTLTAVPFVFLSSSMWGDKDRIQCLALGAAKFITRPIEPQALLAEIRASLAKDEES